MALAYHILAYKHPAQVARLIDRIHHPEDLFVLHFDRRSPEGLRALADRLRTTHPNIILQRPRAVLWGGPQIIDVQIEAMDLALRQPHAWTHFINLTGQDFPLRPRAE